MNEQELNRKLAEWAGFSFHDYQIFEYENRDNRIEDPYWESPKGRIIIKPPDFTQSLDACFKWLVPKLQDKGHNVELYAYEHKGYKATIYKEVFSQRGSDGFDPWLNPIGQEENDNPALALCLAIEKLIDKEELK